MVTRAEAARRHAAHYLAVLQRLGERRRSGEPPPELEREWAQIRHARERSAARPDASGAASLHGGFSRLAPTALALALARARSSGGGAEPPTRPAEAEGGESDRAELHLALSLARHALAISLQDGDRREQARDYATIGIIHHRLGDHARGAAYCRKAREIRRALPRRDDVAPDAAADAEADGPRDASGMPAEALPVTPEQGDRPREEADDVPRSPAP